MASGDDIRCIGKITYNRSKTLGKGCDGTVVFEGFYGSIPVAVKRILSDNGSLISSEINTICKLKGHRNILKYFATEEDHVEYCFIALELCAGTLADWVEGRTDAGCCSDVVLLRQATEGLAYLHSLRIVHRDIKPQNILISSKQSNDEVIVKIADFGFCKPMRDGRSEISMSDVRGTRGWTAPEVLREGQERVTLLIDVFSLGCVFYYVLRRGEHPFGPGPGIFQTIQISKGEFNLQGIDSAAKDIIQKMIDSSPENRPSLKTVLASTFFTKNVQDKSVNASLVNGNLLQSGTETTANCIEVPPRDEPEPKEEAASSERSNIAQPFQSLRNEYSQQANANAKAGFIIGEKDAQAYGNKEDHQEDETNNKQRLSRARSAGSTPGSRRMSPSAGQDEDQDSTGTQDSAAELGARHQYMQKCKLQFKFGNRGSEKGAFTWPRGVAAGPDNTIVIADSSNHRVQVFDSNGRFVKEFGHYGSGEGEFDCPAGVAVNLDGQYIITDRYNHRIQVFDRSGRFLRVFGSQGSAEGKFSYPWGVTTDAVGYIYVCDKENHRVQVFQSDGTFVGKFGSLGNKPGQLENPQYIAVSCTNRVIVSDSNNHRIQVFDLNGRVVSCFGREGSDKGQFKFPGGVSVDDQGYIVVADSGNNRIQIFSLEGDFLRAFGCRGSGDGEFKQLEGIAVLANGNIVVCDRENNRIQVF